MVDYLQVEVVDFHDPRGFLSALTPWGTSRNLEGYAFRGHADDTFELVPSAVRPTTKDRFWSICGLGKPIGDQSEWEYWQASAEYTLLREFFKLADRRGFYVPNVDSVRDRLASQHDFFTMATRMQQICWLPKDLLELAALAQHYGVPTRLLDWSYDPLVSAYFAASSASHGEWMSVWALDLDAVGFMNESIHRSPLSLVTPPSFGNPNLAAQSGLFTSWTSVIPDTVSMMSMGAPLVNREPLDRLLIKHMRAQNYAPDFRPLFLRFRLPSSHAPAVVSLLATAGYDASRIYPGYRGVADEVMSRHAAWSAGGNTSVPVAQT